MARTELEQTMLDALEAVLDPQAFGDLWNAHDYPAEKRAVDLARKAVAATKYTRRPDENDSCIVVTTADTKRNFSKQRFVFGPMPRHKAEGLAQDWEPGSQTPWGEDTWPRIQQMIDEDGDILVIDVEMQSLHPAGTEELLK